VSNFALMRSEASSSSSDVCSERGDITHSGTSFVA
jgi:hypothetical protein